MIAPKSDGQTEPTVEYAPADMICPACRYVGKSIKMKIPPLAREIDSRGDYCPLCVQMWYFRNISKMRPLP